MNPPMEIYAAGDNNLYGTAQDFLQVVTRDTNDVCRTMKLSVVLMPGLKMLFFQAWLHPQKVSKLSSLRAGCILVLPRFLFS